MKNLLLTVPFIVAPVSGSFAASFDCSKAGAPDEHAICDSITLSALDSEMGAFFYVQTRLDWGMSGRQGIDEEARDFLTSRGQCRANVVCLKNLYLERIADLKDSVDKWLSHEAQ